MSPPSRDFHAPRSPGGSVAVGVPGRRHQTGPVQFGRHFGDSGFGMDFGGEFKPHWPWPHNGHHKDHGAWFGYWGYGGDGDAYTDTIPTPDQFGFFAQDSGVSFDGERPVYHYDRGYPYEWFDRAPAMPHRAGPRRISVTCQVELVPSNRGTLDVPVRVCRGS
jgi:hypothetical protein